MNLQQIIEQAQGIAETSGKSWDGRLERLLQFGAQHPEHLPGSRGKPGSLEDAVYLAGYVKRYYADRDQIVTLKTSSLKPDPAVTEVLEALADLSLSAEEIKRAHSLSMAAENLIGLLLERYIARHLEQKGWIWCCGNTLRATDFLKASGSAYILLQVKNRSNSENSSSSAIRVGTVIQKWHRIDARTGLTHWDKLPDNAEGVLTEAGFHQFIRRYVTGQTTEVS